MEIYSISFVPNPIDNNQKELYLCNNSFQHQDLVEGTINNKFIILDLLQEMMGWEDIAVDTYITLENYMKKHNKYSLIIRKEI